MTYKNTKTILFASLIVAMVLPFSGMQYASALHAGENNSGIYNYEERQQNLVNLLERIEDRIETETNEDRKDRYELVIQKILAKLHESSAHENGTLEIDNIFPRVNALQDINFTIEGEHLGCNDTVESWSYLVGISARNNNLVRIAQDFPDTFTSASDGSTWTCQELLWGDSIHFTMQPAFFGEGCHGDIDTTQTANYAVDCDIDISGLWIVGITFDYGSYTETKYTYANV